MAINISGKFKPNGDFPLVDAEDVAMPDGTRLSEYNGMPEVTESHNNQIMQVVNGVWTAVPIDDSSVKTFVDEYISSALEGDY